MTRWLGLSLIAAVLSCAPAVPAQETIGPASATSSSSPADSGLATAPVSATDPAPATGSPTVAAVPEIDSGPARGGHEFQVWVSESHAILRISRNVNDNILQVGGRYGWILTDPIGPGPLRGQFEYAVNFLPLILPFQPNGPTYGFGLDPFTLKWNFQRRGHIIPYVEASAGGMAILKRVPPNGSYWDFTASGGFGVQILEGRYVWSLDGRFYHVSDAGIIPTDPTLNTIEIRLGFGFFRGPRTRPAIANRH